MKRASLTPIILSIATRAFCLIFTNSTTGRRPQKPKHSFLFMIWACKTDTYCVQATTPVITAPPSLVTSAPFVIGTSFSIGSYLSSIIVHPFSGPGIDANLSSYCVAAQYSAYSSQYSQFLELTPTPQPSTFTIPYESSGVRTYTYPFTFPYNATYTSPCCGFCTMWAANARVVYWPTPNPHPDITTLVDSTGFT